MRKLKLFLSLLMLLAFSVGTGWAANDTLYVWNGNGMTTATNLVQKGGTAEAVQTSGSNMAVGASQKGNWCLKGNKGFSNGQYYIGIALENGVNAGDIIHIGYFRTTTSSTYVLGMDFSADKSSVATTYQILTQGDPQALTANGTPVDSVFVVPEGVSNAKYVRIYRNSGSTGLWVSKFVLLKQSTSDPTLTSISVKTAPTKMEYTEGDFFDPTGLVITATYSDESTNDVAYVGNEDKFSFLPTLTTALATTDTKVTITYAEQSVDQAITVNAAAACTNTVTVTKATPVNGDFTLSAEEVCGDGDGGTVTISNIEPADGYELDDITATVGSVDKENNKVTGITENTTITVTFKELPKYTVSFNVGTGVAVAPKTQSAYNADIELPTGTPSETCADEGWTFAGWAEAAVASETTVAPTLLSGTYKPASDVTLYAVYKITEGGGSGAAVGTKLFSEDFSTFAADSVPNGTAAVTTGRVIYGGGSVTYTSVDNGSNITKIYAANLATGTSPELLVGKSGGVFTIAGIPSGGAQVINVSFKQNAQKLTVSLTGEGYSTAYTSPKPSAAGEVSFTITVADKADETFALVMTAGSSNVRVDDISLVVASTSAAGTTYYLSAPSCCEKHNITISDAIEHGSVEASLAKACEGTEVTLTATPDPYYRFKSWSVNDGAVTVTDNKFSMPGSDVTVSATFEEITNAVTIANPEHGTVTVLNGEAAVSNGAQIQEGTVLKASIANVAGYRFTLKAFKTGEESTVVAIDEEGNLTMPAYPITITADELALFAVNVAVNNNTMGSATINGGTATIYVDDDDIITLVATPADGHDFVNWTVSDEKIILDDANSANTTALAGVAGTITANFVAQVYSITSVSANDANFGEVSLDGMVITAIPAEGYRFADPAYTVTGGTANVAQEGNIFTVSGLTADCAITINFEPIPTYTAKWFVNGVAAKTQTAVAGTALEEAPNATPTGDCEDLTFMGWAEAEIATTQAEAPTYTVLTEMPAADVNFYAVYATKSVGKGETQVLKHSETSNTNLAEKTNEAAKFGVSAESWTIVGAKGGASNNVGLNSSAKDIRLYYHADGGNTLTITAPKTIDSVKISFQENYENGWVKVNDEAVTLENGAYPIEATSFVIGNANTSNVQVRFTSVTVVFNAPTTYSDFRTTCPHCNSVTFKKVAENGSFTLTVDEEEVSSVKTCEAVTVDVNIVPAAGYKLSEFTVSGVGATYADGKISIPAEATGELTATATFVETNYVLTLEQTGGASATLVGAKDDAHYDEAIEVSAEEVEGYVFLGWEASGVTLTDASTLIQNFNMPANDVTLTAKYSKILTVAEAIAIIDADKTKTTNNVVIEAYVSGFWSTKVSSGGQISYYVKDLDENGFLTGTEFEAYNGKGLNGAAFENLSDVAVGDKVRILGNIKYYSTNDIYEFDANNYLLARTEKGEASVVVYGEATKTEYFYNEDFEFGGLSAKKLYANGYAEDIVAPEWKAVPATITADATVAVTATVDELTSGAFNVDVTKKLRTLSLSEFAWSSSEDEIILFGHSETPAVRPIVNTHDLTVTYRSGDGSKLTVNETTGEITAILAPGYVSMFVEFAGNEEYASKSVSYPVCIFGLDRVELSGECKTAYEAGETFDRAGLKATAVYTLGVESDQNLDVTDLATWAPAEAPVINANGTVQVTATWNEVTSAAMNIDVTVNTHAVTFAEPIVIMNGEASIASGDAFPKGTELTVVAEKEGYVLTALVAGEEDILAEKKFTVGEAAVEVVATFMPVVKIAGDFTAPTWGEGALTLTPAEDGLTASVKVNFDGNTWPQFKVIVAGEWRGLPKSGDNLYQFHRDWTSDAVTGAGDNIVIKADFTGEYTFTWTYATNTITIGFPEIPDFEYYIAGSFTNWDGNMVKMTEKGTNTFFAEATINSIEYQKFKVVRVQGPYKLWYGVNVEESVSDQNAIEVGAETEYTFKADIGLQPTKTGKYTFQFDLDNLEVTVFFPSEGGGTGVDNTTVGEKAVKTLENGMVIIEKNGVRYNVMGQIVK